MKRKPAAKTRSTKITLTLPDDLLAVLDAAAALDDRTRSSFIAYSLRRLKDANPGLGEPLQPMTAKGLPGPCPRGYVRPCERGRTAAGSASERTASHAE